LDLISRIISQPENPEPALPKPSFGTYSSFLIPVMLFTIVFSVSTVPFLAQASILSFFGFGDKAQAESLDVERNSQTISLPKPLVSPNMIAEHGKYAVEDTNTSTEALKAHIGPLGSAEDAKNYTGDTISIYTVKKGDTVPVIAEMLGVSANTIRYANDLGPKSTIKEGDVLTILPVTGIIHTIKKGDTLKSIAKKYKADINEIALYNNFDADDKLASGTDIIIPDGEEGSILAETIPQKTKTATTSKTQTTKKSTATTSNDNLPLYAYGKTRLVLGHDGPEHTGYYTRPVQGGELTQGLHGWNGVDIAAPLNTPVLAAADGVVITAKNTGWNTGYANYVVIKHNNGTQTLYAHLTKATVTIGQSVSKGQQIGLLGSTGRSTGPHVHFEVRGAKNPLGDNPDYGL
jgi:murein DD-endopeptidase MepM/ murein hydrolase activator NlpD